MLATLAEFPHPGSIAWLRESGERVRLLENDGIRDPLIAYTGLPPRDPALRRLGAFAMPASGNTRLPLASLAATKDEALRPILPELASGRGTARRSRVVEGSAPKRTRQPRRMAR